MLKPPSVSVPVLSKMIVLSSRARSKATGPADLLSLLAQWGADPGGPPDFDGNATVGVSDLLALLANWGPCP